TCAGKYAQKVWISLISLTTYCRNTYLFIPCKPNPVLMKKLALLLLIGLSTACNKSPEGQAYLIFTAMTDGQWKITSFKKAGVDQSAGFNPYSFQFNQNL